MKKYDQFLNEIQRYKLSYIDAQELHDFLLYTIENMEEQPNLLRSSISRIKGIFNKIRKGKYTEKVLASILSSIFFFIEGKRDKEEIKNWVNKLISTDKSVYDDILSIIYEYNHIVNKNRDKFGKINGDTIFNIKSWNFEVQGLEPIQESYEDYIDPSCSYINTYLDEHPEINKDEFSEYVTVNNKADRDMGELQDVSKEEIERLAKEFKEKK